MTPRGRRRGPNISREAILTAARRQFAAAGYDATSLRAVAAEAGVDPAVVLHFFGSKDGLFQAVVGWPFDLARFTARLAAPGDERIGVRIVRTFLDFWEDPTTRAALSAILRSAMTHEDSATLLREFIAHQLWSHVSTQIDGPQAELRTDLAASHLIGVAVLRYILRVEPIASASVEELVSWLGPALSRYLEPDGSGE